MGRRGFKATHKARVSCRYAELDDRWRRTRRRGRPSTKGAITAAAIADIRHTHTRYNELLMSGFDRFGARDAVREAVNRVLDGLAQTGVITFERDTMIDTRGTI